MHSECLVSFYDHQFSVIICIGLSSSSQYMDFIAIKERLLESIHMKVYRFYLKAPT